MFSTSEGQKLAEIYSTPKPEASDDDLSFLRSMIEKPPPPSDPIDFDFLKNELAKRRPAPKPRPRGIELIPPQTKPTAYKPKYLKTSIATPSFPEKNETPFEDERIVHVDIGNDIYESMPQSQENLLIQTQNETLNHQRKPPQIKTPKKYVSWKYIGELDGQLGVLSGKLDTQEEKKKGRNIASDFANLPYITNDFRKPAPKPQPKKPRVKPRDLFQLSIASDSREAARQRSISAMRRERKILDTFESNENDTQLFLQTEEGLVPLCVSRLKQ